MHPEYNRFGKVFKKLLSKPHHKIFLGIFIFAIAVRFYYFSIAGSQPLWWDESDYLAYANNLAGRGGEWIVTTQHNSLFPYLVAGLFSLGLNELMVKFILEIAPSILLVFLTYLTCLKLYSDRRIALISSFLMAVFWPILFNSMRFHLGVPSLCVGLLAIYVFFTGYERREKIFGKINPNWAIPLTVILVFVTYAIRRGYFLFGIFFLVYMLLTRNFRVLIKDKYNWIGLGVAVILLYSLDSLVFSSRVTEVMGSYYVANVAPSLAPFGVFLAFFKNAAGISFSPLLYLLLIGGIMMLANLTLTMGYWKSKDGSKIKSDLFAALTIALTLSYFIFFQKQTSGFG